MEKQKEKPDIREKTLKYGLAYPVDEELVMMILGSGTKDMPVDVMAKKIVETLNRSNQGEVVANLLGLKGVGQGKALAVAAALELGKRRFCHLGAHIKTPGDIVPFVRHYAMCQQEHFLTITLNGGHDIIQIHVVSVGTVNRTLIHPRDVFGVAVRENAAAVILCHNHPSGRSNPSQEDIETTENLLEASAVLGIPVLDHVIIDCEHYFSFLEHGLLFTEE